MIVAVPDGSGRTIDVRTNDPEYAARRAAEWAAENPPIERGAQLGEEDISATGDVLRGVGAGLVSAAEGISTLPFELAGSEEDAQQIRDFFAKYKPETSTELGKRQDLSPSLLLPVAQRSKQQKHSLLQAK